MHGNRNARTLSDVQAALFAYGFHLENCCFDNQTGREETQLRRWLPFSNREAPGACTCEACVHAISLWLHLRDRGAKTRGAKKKKKAGIGVVRLVN